MTEEKIRILIVDDHFVVREGLKGILAGRPEFEVVGEAADGEQGVALASERRPDVALLDLRMPGLDGVGVIRELKRRRIPTRALVLTTYDSDADILSAIEAGATGYLLKDAPREDLFRAIHATARGESWLAPPVAAHIMRHVQKPAPEALSSREIEVLEQVAKGLTNRQIARNLHISEATVKTHLVHIYAKLDVGDRTAAVMAGLERGILRM